MARFEVVEQVGNFTGVPQPITFQVLEGQPAGGVPDGVFFEILALFSELDTQAKRSQARQNLELENVDGGTF